MSADVVIYLLIVLSVVGIIFGGFVAGAGGGKSWRLALTVWFAVIAVAAMLVAVTAGPTGGV